MSWVTTTLVILSARWMPEDEVVDPRGVDRVEARRRLVVEDDLRVEGERAREADALLHSAGEVRGAHVLDPGQTDELERLRDARLDLVLAHRLPVLLAEAVGDVLADGERVEEGGALEQVGDAAADVRVGAVGDVGDVLAVELDRARRPWG